MTEPGQRTAQVLTDLAGCQGRFELGQVEAAGRLATQQRFEGQFSIGPEIGSGDGAAALRPEPVEPLPGSRPNRLQPILQQRLRDGLGRHGSDRWQGVNPRFGGGCGVKGRGVTAATGGGA